jgi:SAM-dependent methyltransferase
VIDKDVNRTLGREREGETGSFVLTGAESFASRCARLGLSCYSCDIESIRLPIADGAIQTLVFSEVLEHLLGGTLHALSELRRILAPDGVMILSTPNLFTLRNRLCFLVGSMAFDTLEDPNTALDAARRIGDYGHLRVFSMKELEHLLFRSGFFIADARYRQILSASEQSLPKSFYKFRMAALRFPA